MSALTDTGIYGPQGWTKDHDVLTILGASQEFIFGDPSFARFRSATAEQCEHLLKVMPAANLDDYQNMAPVLGDLVRACITHPDTVTLSGYIISPPRTDERVTVDGVTIGINPVDDDLCDRFATDSCTEWLPVWKALGEYLGIDATESNAPDEMMLYPQADGSGYAWWVWWD